MTLSIQHPRAQTAPRPQPTSAAVDPTALIVLWRAQATCYERDCATSMAAILRRCAAELESATVGHTVNLTEAAQIAGYSADHIRRMVNQGEIANVGQRHAPRFRPSELPRKGSRRFPKSETASIFSAQSYDGRR